MKKLFFISFLSAAFGLTGWLYSSADKTTLPNVILISIDSLRPDHLGCYGYPKKTSPAIDEVAQSGVLFENAVSTTSWTLPAHMSLFTSMDILVHGVINEGTGLHPAIPTFTQSLKEKGYATGAFCSSPYMNPVFGFDRGFDVYHNTDMERPDYQDTVMPPTENLKTSHRDITSPRITKLAIEWLEKKRSHPFFLFLHMWDVHFDYTPPPPYDRLFDPGYKGTLHGENYIYNQNIHSGMPARDLRHITALYDGEIAYTDFHLGMIFKKLEKLGLDDNTMIIICADHGEEFFEHGDKGHRDTLYDEVVRIPLIVRLPGKKLQGRKIPHQVSIIDIAPTILDYLNIKIPGKMQGRSLLPLIQGKKTKENGPVLLELDKKKAFRTNSWKLLFHMEDLETHILDLRQDPRETNQHLIKDMPRWIQIQKTFYERLEHDYQLARKYREGKPGHEIHLGEEQQKRLKSLGYIQ